VLEDPETVRLEAVWSSGASELVRLWGRQLSAIAGQIADVLNEARERSLLSVLAPVLAGPGGVRVNMAGPRVT
jgi:hypothetical protein